MAIGGLLFSQTFPIQTQNNTSFTNKIFVRICFVLNVLFIILAIFTNYLDVGVIYDEYNKKKLIPSFFKTPYYVLLTVSLAYTIHRLYKSYKQQSGFLKLQLGVFTFSILISAIAGITFNVVLPLLQDYRFILIGPALGIFMSLGFMYLLVNYRYADFRIVFSEFIEKLILTSVFVAFIVTTNYLIRRLPQDKYISTEIIIYSISTFLFLIFLKFTFQNDFFQKFLPIPNFKKQLERFKSEVLKINSVIDLLDLYKSIVIPTLGIKNCSIILTHHAQYKKHKDTFTKIFEYHNSNIIIYDEEYRKFMDRVKINIQLLRLFQILKKSFDVNCIIQLKYLNHVIGYVLLGGYKKDIVFTNDEIRFLTELSEIFAVYLYKLDLYEDLKNFNQILNSKIKLATAKIRKQKAVIEEKYRIERDMIGIMGHELRTPITVARGMTELILAKINSGQDLDFNYLKEKLEKIHISITKEADLIQTMLSTSHVDNSKINLQATQFNIVDTIEFSLQAYQKDAEAKQLKLAFENHKADGLLITNDPNRVQEIINNLISNAIKYTNQGSVTVTLDEKDGQVIFSVKDTGIGIPKKELQNIGKKFYRVHQHLNSSHTIVRAGGTGLGIYVVKGLLKAMGGELLIESEVNVGSTFTAIFPIVIETNRSSVPVADTADMFIKLGLQK
jgi:signal transduction histidine kinase